MVGFLIAAALPPQRRRRARAAARDDANPAMFVVRDADTTVYIFGTFHALDGKSEWFNDRSRTPSSSRTSWCWRRSFRKARLRPSDRATVPARLRSRRRLRFSPPRAWRSTPAVRRACRLATAPTWCFAATPRPKARRSRASRRSNLQLDMFTRMPPARLRRPPSAGTRSPTRWTACRRPWRRCSRRGNAVTRASSCACSASSSQPRPILIG